MATTNSVSDSLNANYKQVYGDDIVELIPDGVKLLKDIKFVEGEKEQGGNYNQAVALKLEHGFSFGTGEEVINLNAAVAGKLENASVSGTQMVGRAQWGWTAVSRAVNSKARFRSATEVVLTNLMTSHKKKLEALMLYGQSGLGTVGSVSGSTIRISDATSAEGIWVGAEGMPIEVRTSAGVLIKETTITGVSIAATTPYISLTVDDIGATAANHLIYFKGAYGKEFKGIHNILTSSGTTLFGIAQSSYPTLWAGSQYAPTSGTATYQKIAKASAIAMPRGGEGKFKVYCHPESWQDIVNDMESARDFGQYKPSILERGVDYIKFHSVAGVMELVAHTCIWRGYIYGLLQDSSWKRIGSTDVTNRIPGMQGADQQFLVLENTAGVESRTYSDFAPFCEAPARSFVVSNITQSA
jgi:hypothetical protein